MGNKKWGRAALSAALLAAAVLGGCSAKQSAAPEQPAAGENGAAAEQIIEVAVASMPKYAPNAIPNTYMNEVEQRFAMKWDFQSIPLSAGLEKYNVMFASGSYPDFIPNMNSPTSVRKWASAGYLLPISDYLDKLPTYRGLFSDQDWQLLLDFAGMNGKLYMLPSVASNDPMTWIYREDAFEQAGVAQFPATLEELRAALLKLRETYPQSVGIGVRGGPDNTGIKNLMNGFRQAFRNPDNIYTRGFWNDPDQGGAVVWSMASDKHRAMLSYLAGLYKEGLIEKEFATITKEQWAAKRLTGKVLIDFQWSSHTVDPEYEIKDVPGAKWAYATKLPSAEAGQLALEFKPITFALFGPIFSNKLANQPEKLERILDYIEWSATPEGQLFHQMGLEGVTYSKENGAIRYMEGLDRQKVAEQHGFDWLIKQSAEVLGSDPLFKKKTEAMGAVTEMYNLNPKTAALTEEEQQTINTTISAMEDIAYQFATKAVMGIVDPASDKDWQKYMGDLEKVGLAQAAAIYDKYLKE